MSSELSQQYNINILERPEENFLMLCEICFVKYQISLFYFVYLTGRVPPPPFMAHHHGQRIVVTLY